MNVQVNHIDQHVKIWTYSFANSQTWIFLCLIIYCLLIHYKYYFHLKCRISTTWCKYGVNMQDPHIERVFKWYFRCCTSLWKQASCLCLHRWVSKHPLTLRPKAGSHYKSQRSVLCFRLNDLRDLLYAHLMNHSHHS